MREYSVCSKCEYGLLTEADRAFSRGMGGLDRMAWRCTHTDIGSVPGRKPLGICPILGIPYYNSGGEVDYNQHKPCWEFFAVDRVYEDGACPNYKKGGCDE